MDGTLLLIAIATPWVGLALLAAFGDSLVGYIDEWLLNSVEERKKDSIDPPGKLLLISGFFGIVTTSIVFVISIFNPTLLAVPIASIYLAILAGIIEVLWLIPYFHAIHKSGALDATPILQTVPIFAGVIGVIFYAEIPTSTELCGTLAILAGALFLNYSPDTKKLRLSTIALMLLASLIISVGLFVFKDAAVSGTITSAIFGNGLGMFIMSSLIWIFYKPYRVQFNHFLKTIRTNTLLIQGGNESLYTLSAVAGQFALVLGPSVMVVSAFSAFHPLFTLLIAVILALFGVAEYRKRLHGVSIVTKTLGIFLIAGGVLLLL